MTELRVVEFPKSNIFSVADSLRALAEKIDAGEYDECKNLAWIIDEGSGIVSIGMMGKSANPESESHLLFSVAQRKIEDLCY